MKVTYTYRCGWTGLTYHVRVENAVTWEDELYPPGGYLRVIRNAKGQALAAPLLSELLDFNIEE